MGIRLGLVVIEWFDFVPGMCTHELHVEASLIGVLGDRVVDPGTPGAMVCFYFEVGVWDGGGKWACLMPPDRDGFWMPKELFEGDRLRFVELASRLVREVVDD